MNHEQEQSLKQKRTIMLCGDMEEVLPAFKGGSILNGFIDITMLKGQLNNSVSQRKLYPRGTASHIMTFKPHQVEGYNLVRTFAAVHTARMGKKKNDLKID
ncbi:hypothetical protein EMCRGX_G018417 [Ephydatia muelleri]